MGSTNKLAVLFAVVPTAEDVPIPELFLSLSGPCAEAASSSSLWTYSAIQALLLEFYVPWNEMSLFCSAPKGVPFESRRDVTCGPSCLLLMNQGQTPPATVHGAGLPSSLVPCQGASTSTWQIYPKRSQMTESAEVFWCECESTFYFIRMCLEDNEYKFLLNRVAKVGLSTVPHRALSKAWIKTKCTVLLANNFFHSFSSPSPPSWHTVTIGGNATSSYSLCTSATYHINRQKLSSPRFYFLLLHNLYHDKRYSYLGSIKWKVLASNKLLLSRFFVCKWKLINSDFVSYY